jgi:tetratricopeptide (TPR) repeat protein
MASRAAQLDPMDLAGRQTLMELYSRRFDWAGVERTADEAVRIDEDDPVSQNYLLVARSTMDGIRQAEHLVQTHPSVDQYLRLSSLYFNNRRYEDCVRAAREAVRLQPDLAEGYANMAVGLHNMGKDDEAVAALREVVRLRPDMTAARGDLEYLLAHKADASAR